MNGDYPRDLVGYADRVPHAAWPDGARVALSFVLNVEEGSETNVLHGDAKNESGLSEAVGGRHPPGDRDLGMESLYEYGPRAGFWRIHRLFTERNLPLTVYACAMALERNPVATEAMAKAGWEFAGHGWRWINHFELSEDEEREHIARAIEITERMTGQRLKGWYCRYAPSSNTRRLLVEAGGFRYDSDSYNDDLPYWVDVDGTDHLVIPYALDTNDVKFGAPASYGSGEDFYRYITDAFDQLWDEGAERPRMLSIGLHQRLVGRPGRTRALARFLDHVQAKGATWITRRVDIAEHWRATHPPAGTI
ncbi:MAG: allantoinase PuuE [Thalassobaculaceae bacterium]|nr:allantoinase PuuE [Thalassobaculaceae bacterium]